MEYKILSLKIRATTKIMAVRKMLIKHKGTIGTGVVIIFFQVVCKKGLNYFTIDGKVV